MNYLLLVKEIGQLTVYYFKTVVSMNNRTNSSTIRAEETVSIHNNDIPV